MSQRYLLGLGVRKQVGCKDTTAPRGHEGGATERGHGERGHGERRHEGGHDGGAEVDGRDRGTERELRERGQRERERGQREEEKRHGGTEKGTEGSTERGHGEGHEEGAQSEEHREGRRRGVCCKGVSKKTEKQSILSEKTAQIERFRRVKPRFRVKSIFMLVSGLPFVCLCTSFFSAQGGREHLFSMCFVDGSDRHPRKIHYDSQVYFVLSLCFVDHCSVVPTHTNTKYLLVPTFILCSRFPSLIIGHCVRYTPTQNT